MMKITPWLGILLISLQSVAQTNPAKEVTTDETGDAPKTTVSSPVDTSTETAQPEMTETVAKGQKLHETGCMKGCHDTSLYTRKNRKITHLEGLKARVQGCATNLNLPWFDDESAAVVTYLDHSYYLFNKPKHEDSTMTKGQKLHETGCMTGCHDTSVYTRENRKITHLEGLKARVRGCATRLNLPWFDDESTAVVTYLNHTYYLFEIPKSENTKGNN